MTCSVLNARLKFLTLSCVTDFAVAHSQLNRCFLTRAVGSLPYDSQFFNGRQFIKSHTQHVPRGVRPAHCTVLWLESGVQLWQRPILWLTYTHPKTEWEVLKRYDWRTRDSKFRGGIQRMQKLSFLVHLTLFFRLHFKHWVACVSQTVGHTCAYDLFNRLGSRRSFRNGRRDFNRALKKCDLFLSRTLLTS